MSVDSNTELPATRRHVEQTAVQLFLACALVMAIICGAIIVSGWFAGVIEDHAERFFWAGAILAFIAIVTLAVAAVPGGRDDASVIRRVRVFIRIGIVLFVIAPVLCLGALVADFYF